MTIRDAAIRPIRSSPHLSEHVLRVFLGWKLTPQEAHGTAPARYPSAWQVSQRWRRPLAVNWDPQTAHVRTVAFAGCRFLFRACGCRLGEPFRLHGREQYKCLLFACMNFVPQTTQRVPRAKTATPEIEAVIHRG